MSYKLTDYPRASCPGPVHLKDNQPPTAARECQIPSELGKIHSHVEALHTQADSIREHLIPVLNPRINDPIPPPGPNSLEAKTPVEPCPLAAELHVILNSLKSVSEKLAVLYYNLEL